MHETGALILSNKLYKMLCSLLTVEEHVVILLIMVGREVLFELRAVGSCASDEFVIRITRTLAFDDICRVASAVLVSWRNPAYDRV